MEVKNKALFEKLELQDGLWRTENAPSVSYPEDGNEQCYQVEEHSFWFQHRNRCILTLLEKYSSKDDIFMDVGAGNGFVAKGIQDAGYPVVMVEPYFAGCLNAKKRGVEYIVHGIANTQNFPDNCVDAIGIFDVLEHIEDRAAFLADLHKMLRPGGKLFITVPAYNFLWSHEDVSAGHFLRYTKKSLRKEMKMAGFKPAYLGYLFSLLPLPIFLLKSLPNFFGMRPKESTVNRDHKKSNVVDGLLAREKRVLEKDGSVIFGSSVIGVFE